MTSSSSGDDLNALIQRLTQNSNGSLRNLTSALADLVEPAATPTRDALVIFFYSLVVLVSLFGNTLVCQVVLRNRGMRTTTNAFISNLAVSDLLMTALNVPFNLARMLLSDWPFGRLMCGLVPFVQVTSVYVSTFTMTCIALHRYRVIVNPLTSRVSMFPSTRIIAGVWVASACLSLPHAVFNDVVVVFTVRYLVRCQVRYPEPEAEVRKWITLLTFASQFVIPLTVTGITYARVVKRVWSRSVPGAAVTAEQAVTSIRAKRKTIKMLILVVVLFALCWLPLNLYHVLQDFKHRDARGNNSPLLFFICHWLAMSSVCYNPFIYWWLNDSFRSAFKSWLTCSPSQLQQHHQHSVSLEHSEVSRQTSSADRRAATWHHPLDKRGSGGLRSHSWILGEASSPERSKVREPKRKSLSWVTSPQTRFSFGRESPVPDASSCRLERADWTTRNGLPGRSSPTDEEDVISIQTTCSPSAPKSQCASPDADVGFEVNDVGLCRGIDAADVVEVSSGEATIFEKLRTSELSPDFRTNSVKPKREWFDCFRRRGRRPDEAYL